MTYKRATYEDVRNTCFRRKRYKLMQYVEAFAASGDEVWEVVWNPGEYAHARSVTSALHKAITRSRVACRVSLQGGKVFLIREVTNNDSQC